MIRFTLTLVFSLLLSGNLFAGSAMNYSFDSSVSVTLNDSQEVKGLKAKIGTFLQSKIQDPETKHKKFYAVVLAVALGPFGVHRLYLGTATKVPLIYTLTLGGGLGFLPLSDIVAILITDDWQKYIANDRVIMWSMP
ncbi:NINE protein [Salibacter sp.]|uniref:NINE protein n=1 Tax=Salibacter sp. TaxID=2010995 RepID=UPI002870AC92|nr:NINE protein [Salibacter sp.]MDR9397470.1 NINE protein [Salibacter sp.]MDR9486704.1 NINE protein [Salibacter sp.]